MIRRKSAASLILFALLLFFTVPISAYTGNGDTIVYVTESGGRYHVISCGYLRVTCIDIPLEDAIIAGFTRCTVCHPPRYTGTAKPGDPKPVSKYSGTHSYEPTESSESTVSTLFADTEAPTPHRDNITETDRQLKRFLFWFGSLSILFFTLYPAIHFSDVFNSDIISPFAISCAAPFISILGCILYKWSAIVIVIVLILSMIVFFATAVISKRKYSIKEAIRLKEAEEQERARKEEARQAELLQLHELNSKHHALINLMGILYERIGETEPLLPIIDKRIYFLQKKMHQILDDNNAYISDDDRLFEKNNRYGELGIVYCFTSGDCYHLESCRKGRGYPVSLLTAPLSYGIRPCSVCKPDKKYKWIFPLRSYHKEILKFKKTKLDITEAHNLQSKVLSLKERLEVLSSSNQPLAEAVRLYGSPPHSEDKATTVSAAPQQSATNETHPSSSKSLNLSRDYFRITCPKCNTQQRANRNRCLECGELFFKSSTSSLDHIRTTQSGKPIFTVESKKDPPPLQDQVQELRRRISLNLSKMASENKYASKYRDQDMMICPKCNTRQRSNRTRCMECGVFFSNAE